MGNMEWERIYIFAFVFPKGQCPTPNAKRWPARRISHQHTNTPTPQHISSLCNLNHFGIWQSIV